MDNAKETPVPSVAVWLKILVRGNILVAAVAVSTAVAAAYAAGGLACRSVLFAWVLVVGCFSVSMVIVSWTWARAPTLTLPSTVFGFVIKTVVLGMLLPQVIPEFSGDNRYWLSYSAVVFVIVWQINEIAMIVKK